MNYLLLIFIFLGFSINSHSQENDRQEYIGTLQTHDGLMITYEISFKVIENGQIEGYSITDHTGDERTKSTIKGVIDLKDKTISFWETGNITTKAKVESNEFCYVSVKNLIIKTNKEKSIIQGKFKGVFNNDSTCSEGYIFLIRKTLLYKQIEKPSPNLNSLKNTDTIFKASTEVSGLKKKSEEKKNKYK